MVAAPCPDPNRWRPLLLGLLPEDESGSLEDHLSSCEICLRRVRATPAEDPLVAAARAAARVDAGVVPEPVRALIPRIKALRLAGGWPDPHETAAGPGWSSGPSTADDFWGPEAGAG